MQSNTTIKTRGSGNLRIFDRAALAALFFSLLTEVLGGAIRYYAVQSGFSWLPYLPHALLATLLIPMLFAYLVSEGVTSTYLAILLLFGVATIYGIFNLGDANQVAFGLWVSVNFLYGIVVMPAIIRVWPRLTPYAFLLWMVAVTGVFINFFYSWPWIGFEYQVGATSIEASRFWRTGGLIFDRLPGFSRTSYDAAVQILVLALFLMWSLGKAWRFPIWIVSGAAIVLTTHKSAIVVFALFSVLLLSYRGSARPWWRLLPAILGSFDFLLPFSMLFVKLDWFESVGSGAGLGPLVLASFAERLELTWPDWLRMIVERGNPLLGRGLGGIGAAQMYFEPTFSAADNIAVYLYGTFGVLGLVLLWVYVMRTRHMRLGGPIEHFFFFCACMVMLEGVTVNVLETGSFMAIAFGASFRYLQENHA